MPRPLPDRVNAVQANLLVSQKVIKRGLRWSFSDKRALKSEENVSYVFKFIFRYFLYFLINNLTCRFQILTAYFHEASDLSIPYQQVLRLLFCFGAILVTPFSLDTLTSYQNGTVMKQSAFHLPIINNTKYRWTQVKSSRPKYIFWNIPKLVFYFCIL